MMTLPTTSLNTLRTFLTDHKDIVFRFVVKEISKGIQTHADRVELFHFGETKYISACKKEDFWMVLTQALEYFVKHELYEEAAQCRDLILKLNKESVEAFLKTI